MKETQAKEQGLLRINERYIKYKLYEKSTSAVAMTTSLMRCSKALDSRTDQKQINLDKLKIQKRIASNAFGLGTVVD